MAGNISRNQALVVRLLDDLGKLMWAMVWDVANHDRWALAPDEVHAELCLEMVKVVNRYSVKPYDELKRLCVTCMRNRVHDLATAYYLTNRKAEAKSVSLDAGFEDDGTDNDNHVGVYESIQAAPDILFDLDEYTEGMSDDAKALIKEVLNPSERTMYFLQLVEQRKRFTSPKGFWTITITPAVMARSMGWSWDRLRMAWDEVSYVVSGVDFDGGLVAKEQ